MKLLEPTHPFFAKPYRRWLTALLPILWGIVELVSGSPGWGMLFLALGLYALWVLVLHFPKE